MAYLKLDCGHEIYYEEEGSPESKTILLIHGMNGCSAHWAKFLPSFSEMGYRVLAADWPGHGRSSRDVDDFTLDFVIDGYLELLEKLDALGKPIAVAGHSAGGIFAQLMYSRIPEKIAALMLLQTSFKFFSTPVREFALLCLPAYTDLVYKPEIRDVIDSISLSAARLSATLFGNDHPLVLMLESGIMNSNADVARVVMEEILKLDIENSLSDIKVPACVVASRIDPIVPISQSREMHNKIHDSELKIIEAFGHNLHIDHFDKLNKVLQDFLSANFPA